MYKKILLTLIASYACHQSLEAKEIHVSSSAATFIGQRIWENECAGKVEGLTSWNKGEEFASLGIGHFIWFPANSQHKFKESFPDLLAFMQKNDVRIPKWLKNSPPCPWNTREEFSAAQNSRRMVELRTFLSENVDIQTQYMVHRLQSALPKLVNGLSKRQQKKVKRQFYRVASTPRGIYALVDYVNFKGEGALTKERYNGKGWGLRQVLLTMKGSRKGKPAVASFCKAAKTVLRYRVRHAPKKRNEKRWLPGWENRIDGYLS